MPRQLTNAFITHVSYVDKAANRHRFFLLKSNQPPVFQKEVKVLTKASDEQKLVYGIVYQPDVVDSQGDYMTAEEIEQAAHRFMENYQNIDKQHNFEAGFGKVVESYVVPEDLEIGGQIIPKGSWVLVTRASDDIWEEIKNGHITGYSMGGTAEVITESSEDDVSMMKSFQTAQNFFQGKKVAKEETIGNMYGEEQKPVFWGEFTKFEDVFSSEMQKEFPDVEQLRKVALDFANVLTTVATCNDLLQAVGKKPNEQPIAKQFHDVIASEITSLHERIGNLEKARGISKALETQGHMYTQKQKSVWDGLFKL
ncbi:XkdF-like putative serine protease domain-containing protein [Brevibacillus sp. SYSU BS000544]|uniref:XkdF-like putative serine protease domain-containing protein n=1 Tax=Brevibacillus sp. SYSU BS000544 TaxID=3416443 RepID=UPI003CE5C532